MEKSPLEIEIEMMKQDDSIFKIDHLRQIVDSHQKPFLSPALPKSSFHARFGGDGQFPLDTFVKPLSKIKKDIFKQEFFDKQVQSQFFEKLQKKLDQQASQKIDESLGISGQDQQNQRKKEYFLKGGPRAHVHFQPETASAAIVTCGGLCPGLNVIIRELTHNLQKTYNIKKIFGIQYGYRGFYTYNWLELDTQSTQFIHKRGGSILGSSRGGFNLEKITKKVLKHGVKMLFIIGGDGTQRGANVLYKHFKEKKLNIAVCGLPKTIDNDIIIIDRSFGYQSAVDQAIQAINCAETESLCLEYGIGMVRLMGRSAGHIALEASLSHRGVQILLLPEVPFQLYGANGLLNHIYQLVLRRHHCVIVVAEGAAESVLDLQLGGEGFDESGNKKFFDIGVFLKNEIKKFSRQKGLNIDTKYIDPSYMVRGCIQNHFDTQFCSQLAYHAVHGAMAGFTGFCVGKVNGRTVYVPLREITKGVKRVDIKWGRYQRFLGMSGMPMFVDDKKGFLEKLKNDSSV